MSSIDPTKVVTHAEPVWRANANYILMVDLADFNLPGRFEQLWLADLGGGNFKLCCLPFFAYGYSLGDVIQTKQQGGREVLGKVAVRSGRGLIRVLIHSHGPDHAAVHDAIVTAGCMSEWRDDGFVAVDLEHGTIPNELMAAMTQLYDARSLQWEWAGSGDIPGAD